MVGELSPKATVMAKMLVRALQLLLWAGDRSVLGKQERERRLQQIYGTAGIGTVFMCFHFKTSYDFVLFWINCSNIGRCWTKGWVGIAVGG